MDYFLERIAKHLFKQHGEGIREHCLVFPSRRAGLYFLKYLAGLLDKPVWTPSIMTISEFFNSHSDLIIADDEILLYELYKTYRNLNKSAESFDEFYFWGDILLNDFDDVDKYLADASVLFRNVRDYKNIENQFGDIDPEQAEIIKRFWKNFEPEKSSPQKSNFITIWSLLNDLYNKFRESLRARKIAYEGMIFRDVAEMYLNGTNKSERPAAFHFIGFNALNKCEKAVMTRLQNQGCAYFYWDYDNSYIKSGKHNSAGRYIVEDLKIFKNDMPEDWRYETYLTDKNSQTQRRIIETTSDVAQVKLIPELLRLLSDTPMQDAHHTAVILADENLIIPLLSSLPSDIGDINITMGYPFKMTTVYTLVKSLFNLQRNAKIENGTLLFVYNDVLEILRHKLISNILNEEKGNIEGEIKRKNLVMIPAEFLCRTDSLSIIFTLAATPIDFSDYLRKIITMISAGYDHSGPVKNSDILQKGLVFEFIYRLLLSVNRLDTIAGASDITLSNETYIRILDKILRNQSVPFSGEPLSGIQVMGFLETRALDFRNIIMLSVNEGVLPTGSPGSSFIPYSLREAFSLPVINHQESIYAYHFYRLLHRSENVTFIYNSNSNGLRTGEMSRFLIQMKYEQVLKPAMTNLNFNIRIPASVSQIIEKEEHHLKRLHDLYVLPKENSVLSPTAINTWLNCRMRFFFRYINGLKEPETILSGIDHAALGHLLHGAMRNIYHEYKGIELSTYLIKSILKDQNYLLKIIDSEIHKIYNCDQSRPLSGSDIIVRNILLIYLQEILKADINVIPIVITELEQPFYFVLELGLNGKMLQIKTGGIIDRVDNQKGITRILDYKTGTASASISSVDDLFKDDRERDADGWLQTILYCEAYLAAHPGLTVRPAIYRVKEISSGKFSDMLIIKENRKIHFPLDDYQTIREIFIEGLKEMVGSIFNPDQPFRMTDKIFKCGFCPYKGLCQR